MSIKGNTIGIFIISIFLLIVGIMLLLFTQKVQSYILHQISLYKNPLFKFASFPKWVESSYYILTVRIIGIILICIGGLLFYTLLTGK
jgi:hypothetical protein